MFTVEDNKAKKAPVKVGFGDGTKFEIVSGVKAVDPVILVGSRALSDGQAVNVTEAK